MAVEVGRNAKKGEAQSRAGWLRIVAPLRLTDDRAMPRLVFTPQLRRFLEVPDVLCSALTLRAALGQAFAANPRLSGYVLDEQGHLRANVVAFIDGRRVDDRVRLDDVLLPDSTVHVLQALSGG